MTRFDTSRPAGTSPLGFGCGFLAWLTALDSGRRMAARHGLPSQADTDFAPLGLPEVGPARDRV
jgi:hypothetical protein